FAELLQGEPAVGGWIRAYRPESQGKETSFALEVIITIRRRIGMLLAKRYTFWRTGLAAVCVLVPVLSWLARCAAYSVLSHEAIIDSAWDTNIKPVLLKRFPHATPDELRQAHGYAYGGAIIQDLGYYPHGSPFFSDL